MRSSLEPDITVRQARAQYFARNHFGNNGGYDARWVKLKVGSIPLCFPNTKGRVRAVRLHDVHHVLTGYETTWMGEAEIGAWEIASGCGCYLTAWILNLPAIGLGLILSPQRVYRAFLRGRQSSNYYYREFRDDLLEQPVELAQRELFLNRPMQPASARDKLAFVAWSTVGLAMLVWPVWPVAGAAMLWYLLR